MKEILKNRVVRTITQFNPLSENRDGTLKPEYDLLKRHISMSIRCTVEQAARNSNGENHQKLVLLAVREALEENGLIPTPCRPARLPPMCHVAQSGSPDPMPLPPGPTGEQFDPLPFLREFVKACRIDMRLAESTVKERARYASYLCDFLEKHPAQATKDELRNFLEQHKDENAVKTLRVLYGRFLNSDIAQSFKVPQSALKPKTVPTGEQLRSMYKRLRTKRLKLAFLFFASGGLRRHELLELTKEQIDKEKRMIMPSNEYNQTKHQWTTFYTPEADSLFKGLDESKIFEMDKDTLTKKFRKASGGKITPQILRDWFCSEMGRLGVPDRYVDAFCGRIPRSVLARHYTDFSPERLKGIYEKAGLKVLG